MARLANNEPVEARSLGHLTSLAANPPTYPRNPTQKPLEPLVLYIVRVPGSRDVFLSPLKPQKSSVSAESLNASLYYLHVSSPQDEALLETIEQEKREKQQENRNRNSAQLPQLNRVQRKPVPGTAVTEQEEVEEEEEVEYEERRPALPPRPPPEELAPPPYYAVQPPELNYSGNGFGGHPQRNIPEPETRRPRLPRRPLPPLPDEQGSNGQLSPQRQDELDHSIRDARRWSAQPSTPPRLGDSLSAPPVDFGHASPGRASWDGGARPSIRPGSNSPHNDFDPFLRDQPGRSREYTTPHRSRRSYDKPRPMPQAAAPFHITLIRRDPTHGHQWNVGTITNHDSQSKIADDGSITIEITTPGYKKFAVDKQPLSLESLGLNPPKTSSSSLPPRPRTAETPQAPTGPTRFIRKVSLTYPPSTRHRRRSPQSSPERSSPPRSRSGHYTFISPWDGTCTFLTGVNGHSLKCKHIIPTLASLSSFSSPQPPAPAVSVAEIRFNLPTFPFPPSGSSSHGHSHSHSSSYGDFPGSPSSPAEPGRLDLSLARERAGGGLRGKSAKLGKLIIEDEGLKMLDLMIAACMGVWWGVYDHVYG